MLHTAVSFAPGRVELLGNHTDYNEGYVLSAAIHLGVTIRAERLESDLLEVSSETNDQTASVSLHDPEPFPDESWVNYPLGVVKTLRDHGYPIGGMRLRISSNLPLGAGLSSSAALEVATAMSAVNLSKLSIEPMVLAQICQQAENEFVGVQCGLLDQASSVFGKLHQIIRLDFRRITAQTIPMPENLGILILNSNVAHQLTGGEYNERREQCSAAAAALKVKFLRDATSEMLRSTPMDELIRRRGLHITGENERVLAGVQALQDHQIHQFGELMFASHESSRINFENSTPHLDALVRIAGKTEGVLGARLTGGGFGGSIVALVEKGKAEAITHHVSSEYQKEMGIQCTAIFSEPSEGARIVSH